MSEEVKSWAEVLSKLSTAVVAIGGVVYLSVTQMGFNTLAVEVLQGNSELHGEEIELIRKMLEDNREHNSNGLKLLQEMVDLDRQTDLEVIEVFRDIAKMRRREIEGQ